MMIKEKLLPNKQLCTKSNKEYFYYSKKGYYAKNCHLRPKQKPEDKKTAKKQNEPNNKNFKR